jgi:hypothetical protein
MNGDLGGIDVPAFWANAFRSLDIPIGNKIIDILGLGRACLPSSIVGFFNGAFQLHLDQMQRAPVNNPARHRLQ